MTCRSNDEPQPVRLVFELARQDNPRLYDELIRFPQGAKRVNRLRVLAYDGLLAQYGVFAFAAGDSAPVSAQGRAPSSSAGVTNAVFEPGLAE